MQTSVHFVGFVHPDQPISKNVPQQRQAYENAVRYFGQPDFIHRRYDFRAVAEICDDDVVVFARDVPGEPEVNAFDDSNAVPGEDCGDSEV